MDHHHVARLIAIGRLMIGGGLLIAPRLVTRSILGDVGGSAAGRVVVRALAIRDLALGVGTLRALGRGEPVDTWVRLGAVADGVDAAAVAATAGELGSARAVGGAALAGSVAIVGWRAADDLAAVTDQA